MGILGGGKPSIGDVGDANKIKDIADKVRDAGVGVANNNNVQEAKALSNTLLSILGILSPVPGSRMTSDVAQESVNNAIDALASRKKQIDDAIDSATGNNTGVGTSDSKDVGADNGVGGSGDGSGAAGGLGGGGAGAGARATIPPRRDPLVLDLDGDGIETIRMQDGAVILFDHDADGVKKNVRTTPYPL